MLEDAFLDVPGCAAGGDPMPAPPRLTPIEQAERAREVVGALGRLEDRIVADGLPPGPRVRLAVRLGDATCNMLPGAAEEVTRELAMRLPPPLRGFGRRRPDAALSIYDELVRDPCRHLDLVRGTHRALGGSPRHPSARHRRESS
jgi:hypothetical protein